MHPGCDFCTQARYGRTPPPQKNRHILNAKALTLCQTTGEGMYTCMFWVNKMFKIRICNSSFLLTYTHTHAFTLIEKWDYVIYVVWILMQSFFFLFFWWGPPSPSPICLQDQDDSWAWLPPCFLGAPACWLTYTMGPEGGEGWHISS